MRVHVFFFPPPLVVVVELVLPPLTVELELEPDARTGKGAVGDGSGRNEYESWKISFCAPSRKLYKSL